MDKYITPPFIPVSRTDYNLSGMGTVSHARFDIRERNWLTSIWNISIVFYKVTELNTRISKIHFYRNIFTSVANILILTTCL